MAEKTKVKSEQTEAKPDIYPDTGRTGRGNNPNQNQRFRKNTENFVEKTTEKFVRSTKAIRGHIFDSTLFGQDDQYQKILKEIAEYPQYEFQLQCKEFN